MAIVDKYEPITAWCVPFVDWRRLNANGVHNLAAERGELRLRDAKI